MARLLAGTAVERTDVAKNPNGGFALNGANQALVAANKDRVSLIVSNTSAANKMFLALNGVAAAANTGILVPPNSTITLNGYSGAVNIIGTAADVVTFAEI